MSPKQKKIAAKAPPPNKIDAKDFAVLKAEKAKGRGMGLQDEKVKPGKVMKANEGEFVKRRMRLAGASNINSGSLHKNLMKSKNAYSDLVKTTAKGPKNYISRGGKSVKRIPLAGKATSVGSTTMKGMKFSDKAKMVDAGKINKATGKFTSMSALRESIGYRPGESTDNFNKRRMALAAAKKTASASRIGKIALGIGAAGVAAQQYLKSKMNKKKDVKKKMGGGMMKKYSVGGGADSGKVGEMKSRIAVTIDRLKKAHRNTMGRRSGPMGNITDNDMEKIKNLVGKNKAARPIPKKMGGGMMKKPMGYKDGTKPGAGPLGGAGRAAGLGALGVAAAGKYKHEPHNMSFPGDFKNFSESSQLKEAREKADSKYKKDKQHPVKGKHASFDRLVNSGKVEQSAFKKYRKDTASNRESGRKMGGMMKPSGYRTGTMVKARGCKLGRTRPTKIT